LSVRPPSLYAPQSLKDPLQQALEHEIMAEKAGTLGRLLKRLEKQLAALRAHEDGRTETANPDPVHQQRIDEAGEALWHVVIQRDLCGFSRTEQFLRDMNIPPAVRLRMGVVKRPTRDQTDDQT